LKGFPTPDTIISSDAFMNWCEAVEEYVEAFSNDLCARIALEQRRGCRDFRIIQGLVRRRMISHAEELGFYPIKKAKELENKILLFAKLSESDINSLCEGTHSYVLDGRRVSVHLKRTDEFIKAEENLSRYFSDKAAAVWVKYDYLPHLTFPFLPYSRKFIEIEVGGERAPEDTIKIRSALNLDRFEFDAKTTFKAGSLRRDLLPVWNVFATSIVVGPQVLVDDDGTFFWQPRESDPLRTKDIHVLHGAVDKRGNAIKINYSSGRLVSELRFHRIDFSVIETVESVPKFFDLPVVGEKEPSLTDHYWYRTFLQAAQLTKRDIGFLLDLVPETRGLFELVDIEVNPCSETQIDRMLSDERPFFDHLWYLRRDEPLRSLSLEEIKVLTIHLKPKASVSEAPAFLIEDLANYFASICALFLPMNFDCQGVIRK